MTENSNQDTVVGTLTTSDPDSGQTFKYSLLSNAGGRFKLIGSTIKVRGRNSIAQQTCAQPHFLETKVFRGVISLKIFGLFI